MTRPPSSVTFSVAVAVALLAVLSPATWVHGLGSDGTLATTYGSGTVCGVVAGEQYQRIECQRRGEVVAVEPGRSYVEISGGRNFFCGLRSGGYSLLCWYTNASANSFQPQRVYYNDTVLLESISVGDDHVCAVVNGTGAVKCWRGGVVEPDGAYRFKSISSGMGFSCGILRDSNRVRCWGRNPMGNEIQQQFGNISMLSIVAGGSRVCGFNITGNLLCKGRNGSAQLGLPSGSSMGYLGLALGENHSCAIRQLNGSVVCWGGGSEYSNNVTEGISFVSIVAGLNYTCGLVSSNFTVLCWGAGWPGESYSWLALPKILPGSCVQSSCVCGIYPLSDPLCNGNGVICELCDAESSVPPAPPPPQISPPPPPDSPTSSSSPSRGLSRGLLAFAIVGSVGGFMGICTVIYCLWRTGIFCGKKKVHNSVQPTISGVNSNANPGSNNSPPSRSSTILRQGSRIMRRQRSGTSSKHADRAEEFSLSDLAAATNNFALENKIGAGSFGIVYKGKLSDGREVAIKRGETGSKMKKFQEKESAFESELAFLSRLHHKHLVKLVGFCEEMDERLLVYEYMKNGALYDHLHNRNNVEKSSSPLNSWKMRIKISLDAARGIEYLHTYAVPPIIHRDIKSSNILLDVNWTARVSDFGLSLMGPEPDRDYRPMKAAGTIGYIDPEYYGLNVLTEKSDVYGLGVVLLELLTGKRAIFKDGDNGGTPVSVVDYAVSEIMAGELAKVLDPRVGSPELNEAEAVELVAYTAMHCVNLEGKERPTMNDIVANLERALALCEDSHGSISSGSITLVSG